MRNSKALKQHIDFPGDNTGFIELLPKGEDSDARFTRLIINQSVERDKTFGIDTQTVLLRGNDEIVALYIALHKAIKESGITVDL